VFDKGYWQMLEETHFSGIFMSVINKNNLCKERGITVMGSFSWLHFSDLHLTPKTNFDTGYAREQLLDFLRNETVIGALPCDYIFITGDIAHQNNYDGVKDFATNLFHALNWSPENYDKVFWAVGNHDISRNNPIRNLIIADTRNAQDREDLFDERMNSVDFQEILISKGMNDYHHWHKKLLGRDVYANNSISPHTPYRLLDLNLIVLNTCLTSCDDNDEHSLLINESGLKCAFEGFDHSNPTFVIGHHGKEFFTRETQDNVGHLFNSKNVDLYLCGHSHRLGYDIFPQAGRDLPQIVCGGGISDKYSKFSFMHGFYDKDKDEVTIKPYSYAEHGNRNWQFDGSLHLRLDGIKPLKLTGEKQKAPLIKQRVNIDNDSSSKQWEWSSGFFRK